MTLLQQAKQAYKKSQTLVDNCNRALEGALTQRDKAACLVYYISQINKEWALLNKNFNKSMKAGKLADKAREAAWPYIGEDAR